MANEKVLLIKTTKIAGRFVPANTIIEVSPKEKADYLKRGIVSNDKGTAVQASNEVKNLKDKLSLAEKLNEKHEARIEELEAKLKNQEEKVSVDTKAETDLLGKK